MMENLHAERAMNLVGLILIAALSGGIVAVSLRLRAHASPARMWTPGSTGFSRKLVLPYELPTEGGTTNIDFSVIDKL